MMVTYIKRISRHIIYLPTSELTFSNSLDVIGLRDDLGVLQFWLLENIMLQSCQSKTMFALSSCCGSRSIYQPECYTSAPSTILLHPYTRQLFFLTGLKSRLM